MNTKKEIAFLFGAGISIPSGIPTTSEITDRILSGKDIINMASSKYPPTRYFDGKNIIGGYVDILDTVPRIVKFLNYLKDMTESYYEEYLGIKKHINYEDLYYIVVQIYQSEFKNYENAALKPLLDRIKADCASLLNYKISSEYEEIKELATWKTEQLISETDNYIRDIIEMMLVVKNSDTSYLNFLKVAQESLRAHIFTLNNDNIIETFFKDSSSFTNGFKIFEKNVSIIDYSLFDSPIYKVKLYKLHGSLDWRRLNNEDYYFKNIAEKDTVVLFTPEHKDTDTDEITKHDIKELNRPLILIGRFNKMFDYTYRAFTDLQYRFYNVLNRIENLIVCGYSFNDKPINSRIIDWMDNSKDTCMIIIHKDIEKFKQASREAVRIKWDDWYKSGKVKFIGKYLCPEEELKWEEIEKFF